MYSIIAFVLVLAEVVAAGAAYALHADVVFQNVIVYGSPFYLCMNLLNGHSALIDKSPLYIGFAVFHVLKYVMIFRAQLDDGAKPLRIMAIMGEIAYLALSAYYIY